MNVVNQIRYELSIDPQSTYVRSLPFWKITVLKVFSTKRGKRTDLGTTERSTTQAMYSRHSKGGTDIGTASQDHGRKASVGIKVDLDAPAHAAPGMSIIHEEDSKHGTESKHDHLSKSGSSTGKTNRLMVLDMTGEIPLKSLMWCILIMLIFCIAGVFLEIYLVAPIVVQDIYSPLACMPSMNYARFTMQILILVLTPVILYSIHDVEDSMNLRNEIFATSLVNMTIFFYFMLITFIPQLGVLKGEVGGGLMGVIGVFVQHCVTVIWPLVESYKIERNMKAFHETQLEGGQMTIECMVAVLENPVSFLDFKKELLVQFCIENGIFYDEYRKAERKMKSKSKRDPDAIEKELRRFDNMFIASGSQQELNIPYKIKKAYQELVKEGSADFEILLPIKDEVLKMMFLNTYPRYLKAQHVPQKHMNSESHK